MTMGSKQLRDDGLDQNKKVKSHSFEARNKSKSFVSLSGQQDKI